MTGKRMTVEQAVEIANINFWSGDPRVGFTKMKNAATVLARHIAPLVAVAEAAAKVSRDFKMTDPYWSTFRKSLFADLEATLDALEEQLQGNTE